MEERAQADLHPLCFAFSNKEPQAASLWVGKVGGNRTVAKSLQTAKPGVS